MRKNLIVVGIIVGVLSLGAGLAWALVVAAHSPTSANRAEALPPAQP